MTFMTILTSASAPGIALLTFFYLKDKYDPEPLGKVIKMFIFGLIIVFPTLIIQRGMLLALSAESNEFAAAFLISGMTEEFVKWFVFYYIVYKHPELDEPYDAIVYAVAISLGFATLENAIYIWSYDASLSTILMRGFLPVSGHALFAVLMGYYFAKAKFKGTRKRRYLLYALILPALWHGVYDYILLANDSWLAGISVFMVILWLRSLKKVKKAKRASPFHPLSGDREIGW